MHITTIFVSIPSMCYSLTINPGKIHYQVIKSLLHQTEEKLVHLAGTEALGICNLLAKMIYLNKTWSLYRNNCAFSVLNIPVSVTLLPTSISSSTIVNTTVYTTHQGLCHNDSAYEHT